ncbi:hypothetical protein KP509_24G075900 [Ceratopteris richardii]|uniref:Uncharacterized protein n=1 Tax=Ceratopteris richardii TaxID=49495 RepID=A0A8T2RWH2_CERRI|nr:hypothetical protein KP509_24G075900 [Ceratopteris richardii]
MEIYCMYGVGILRERSYMYKMALESGYCHIPFHIDTRAEGDSEGYLKGGVHFVDGDEIVPVHRSGFVCKIEWVNLPSVCSYTFQCF